MRLRCDAKSGPVWRAYLEPGDKPAVVLDGPGVIELGTLLHEVERDPACRVLVIESASEVEFCRGMDLAYLIAHAGEDQSEKLELHAGVMLFMRQQLSKIVICVVDGEAVGGGVGLAAAADLVLASPRASFSLPECVFGLIPAIVLPLLCERMPVQRARALAMSGRRIDQAEAHAIGLVDELVDDPRTLETALRRLIKQLLRLSPAALAKLKRFSSTLPGLALDEALTDAAARTAADLLEPETIAALQAFHAGELPPHFERYRPGKRAPTPPGADPT